MGHHNGVAALGGLRRGVTVLKPILGSAEDHRLPQHRLVTGAVGCRGRRSRRSIPPGQYPPEGNTSASPSGGTLSIRGGAAAAARAGGICRPTPRVLRRVPVPGPNQAQGARTGLSVTYSYRCWRMRAATSPWPPASALSRGVEPSWAVALARSAFSVSSVATCSIRPKCARSNMSRL